MMQKDIAIVFDCGATNVRVIAMDTKGSILASKAMSNETDDDPCFEGGRIWDLDKLWGKLCDCSLEVTKTIDAERIAGITFTTFGVDGALVGAVGELLYPVISWQCGRTQPIMESIDRYMPLDKLYELSGVFPYAFNTINKLIWFKENKPDLLEKAHRFLFIPSLLINKLTGAMQNDATMMGTSMMTDLKNRRFSQQILDTIGVDPSLFGEIAEPGDKAGVINLQGSEETGLPLGMPVFFAGHDTQFAIFGSGAKLNQPVLSSGTWEILMSRSTDFRASKKELEKNLTTEGDAINGVFNIGQNWLGSGVLEWFSKNFYPELSGNDLYRTMIEEATQVLPGSHGLQIDPSFYDDGTGGAGGTINGLTINTKRHEIYRALLESLAFRLREGLEALEEAGGFKAERIICVGGGSKNNLWNQLRANVCQVPIQLIDQKETTVLGGALFVFAGSKVFSSVDEARENICYNPHVIQVNSEEKGMWDDLYNKYLAYKKQQSINV
ncbi:MAG: L-fuculokinase [Marinilabiliaceae bacterium]|nr:L-fuculokinase [Marinilabiliaceae bacterium]